MHHSAFRVSKFHEFTTVNIKYKLLLNNKLQDEFKTEDAFDLFIKESKIDINKLYFAAELENICRFGAVDYEINKAIHEFGNEKEDNLNNNEVYDNYQKLMDFKIKDMYDSLDKKEENEFKLLKKAYKNFGGFNGIKKAIAIDPISNTEFGSTACGASISIDFWFK